MKAMILSAGTGSRLYPLTELLPKPMLPIGNIPALAHAVLLCKKHGIKDIKMNLHYLPEEIDSYFQDGSSYGLNISYSIERSLLGTAGAVKRVSGFFNETFVVLSGDGYTDIDLSEMLNYHKRNKSLLTIAVKAADDTSKYGVVITNQDGKIAAFQEKPKKHEALSNLANLGIYIIEPEVLELIPRGVEYDFGKELFPKLASMNSRFYAYQTNAQWTDIGDIKEYWTLNLEAAKRRFRVSGRTLVNRDGNNFSLLSQSELPASLRKKSSGYAIIGKNCKFGNNVELSGIVTIGDNVEIADNAKIFNTVILANSFVGSNVEIKEAVIHQNYHVSVSKQYGFYVDDMKILAANNKENKSRKSFLKDMISRGVAAAALFMLLPLFAIVALLIKLDSPGPVFYISRRIKSPGIRKKSDRWSIYSKADDVKYYVFRTMFTDADKKVQSLNNKYQSGPFIKIENDPRVTRVGKWLRKTSIDELPLFINVLRGEMSLVGIWALPVYEAESLLNNGLKTNGSSGIDLSETARQRFKGQAGLAGLWQSRGRSNLTAEERAIHDSYQAIVHYYSERFKKQMGSHSSGNSLTGFFKMLFDTFLSVVSHKGAM